MEVSQFTYFQQVGGIECSPVSTELTYGLERLATYIQGVESIYDLDYNGAAGNARITYRDVFLRNEKEFLGSITSEHANVPKPFEHFRDAEEECQGPAGRGTAPAGL